MIRIPSRPNRGAFVRCAGLGARCILAGVLAVGLAACAGPERVPRPSSYDFGPEAPGPAAGVAPAGPPLALAEVEAPPALDGTAMLYRLAYADGRETRAYAQSRWSMAPAQLLRQRLRARLGAQRPVLAVGEAPAPQVLRVELEEFSQVFESPQRSVARVRLRATLLEASAPPGQQVRQRTFVAQRPAPSPDAAGGVQALHEATDEVAEAVAQWVRAAP